MRLIPQPPQYQQLGTSSSEPSSTSSPLFPSVIVEDFTLDMALGVGLRLLGAEASWFEGNSFAETIFTCVPREHSPPRLSDEVNFARRPRADRNRSHGLVLQPPPLPRDAGSAAAVLAALRAAAPTPLLAQVVYTLLVTCLKTVDLCRQVIIFADIYEEEDFSPTLQGFKLCEDVSDVRLFELLDDTKTRLQQQQQQQSPEASGSSSSSGDDKSGSSSSSSSPSSAAAALVHLLAFRKAHFEALSLLACFSKAAAEDGAGAAALISCAWRSKASRRCERRRRHSRGVAVASSSLTTSTAGRSQ